MTKWNFEDVSFL